MRWGINIEQLYLQRKLTVYCKPLNKKKFYNNKENVYVCVYMREKVCVDDVMKEPLYIELQTLA